MVWKVKKNSESSDVAMSVSEIYDYSTTDLDINDTREYYGSWPHPVVKALRASEDIFSTPRNKYDMYDKFVENDPDLETVIGKKASMVRKAYRGLRLRVGQNISPEEEVIIEFLKNVEESLNIKRLFYVIAKKVLRYGDWVMLKSIKGGMITLQPLPIKYLSVVDNFSQLEQWDSQIFFGNYYVLNEFKEERRRIFHQKTILHFSLEPEGTEVFDQYRRYVFNTFSVSPLLPLTQFIFWKHNIIVNDIILRHKLVPREVHKVNTLGINPSTVGDPGDDLDTRIDKANNEVERVLSEYEKSIAFTGADRGYVVQAEGVEIEMLEPKGLKYHEPNKVIDQINATYARRIGIPMSEVVPESGSSYAGELIHSSMTSIETVDIAQMIADKLLSFIREYIVQTYPNYAYLTNDIYMDVDLVLNQDEERRFRVAALMKEIGEFTSAEIREFCGYERLTDEQKGEIDEMIERDSTPEKQGPGFIGKPTTGQLLRRDSVKPTNPVTPQQKETQQIT